MPISTIGSNGISSVSAAVVTGTQTLPKGTLPTGSVLQVVSALKGIKQWQSLR